MIVNCKQCGKDIFTYPSRIKNGKGFYCSRKCFYDFFEKKIKINCLMCKKEIFDYKGRKYCSKICWMDDLKNKREKFNENKVCNYCKKEFIIIDNRIMKWNNSFKGKFCSRKCYWKSMKGEKSFAKNLGIYSKRSGITGKNHPRWSGLTPIELEIRTCTRYLQWRKSIFERDNYTCIFCNENKGGNLNADHIVPLSAIIKRFCVMNLREAHGIDLIWDIDNGRTLCKKCHEKTETWGIKAKKYDYKKIIMQTVN